MSNSNKSASNEDILKSLRKLNSCITLSSVSSTPASDSDSAESSEVDEREGSGSPKGPNEKESAFIKDLSKRCISISIAKKGDQAKSENNKNEETSDRSPTQTSNSQDISSKRVSAYKCSFCGKGFSIQNELVRHILSCKRLGGSVSFSSNNKNSESEEEEEEEEESSEEESDTARSIAALKATGAVVSIVKQNNPALIKSTAGENTKSAISNLPRGISVTSSSNISIQKSRELNEKRLDTESNRSLHSSSSSPKSKNISNYRSPSLSRSSNSSPHNSDSNSSQNSDNPFVKQYFNKRKQNSLEAKESSLTKENVSELPESYNKKIHQDTSSGSSFEFTGFPQLSEKAVSAQFPPVKRHLSVGRKSTAKKSQSTERSCPICNVKDLGSWSSFYVHHRNHIRKLTVPLKRIPFPERYNLFDENSNNSEAFSNQSSASSVDKSDKEEENISAKSPDSNCSKSESGSIKLTFKISQVEDPDSHTKKKKISILNPEDMQETIDKVSDSQNSSLAESSNILFPESNDSSNINMTADSTPSENPLPSENQFPNPSADFGGAAAPAEAPHSAYEPQFESFTGDWLNEYESGERIAAAMTGVPQPQGDTNNMLPPGHDPMHGMYNGNQSLPSQDNNPQGSFEQLCLNDSYNQNQPNSNINGSHNQHLPYNNSQNNDIFSGLSYLNPAERHVNSIGQPTEGPYMNGSNPSTPNSNTSHPSPGDSFRSLATSPQSTASPMSSDTLSPTPAFSGPSVDTGMTNNSSTPLSMPQETPVTAPRLTIANNLMPPSTSPSSLTPLMGVYNNQQSWSQVNNNSSPNFSQNYMTNNMGPPSSVRPTAPGLPVGYRPSPRPRVRGRPPLMDGLSRNVIRGPGRPPLASAVAPNRGGMMQRGGAHMYGSGTRMSTPTKRPLPGSLNNSPAKTRREDINVPSRQKDNDCQIIAVANRNEGMPVISNVQGNSREDRSRNSVSSVGGDSTIHLSDSITLSVRPNTIREPAKTSKSGDAGVVANLLASRGITVTPAAGEKENGTREDRRLPSASDLNLSSAISVHPPSRDRDGFAVPQPPQNRSVVNDNAERPIRPPTVDLTQEVSPHGSLARAQCHQCQRSFPTESMLADHAKVHQSQQQSRMPYKCHLCNAGFSSQKGQQAHYQQFHQLHLSAGDLAIPIVDVRNPVTQRKMQQLGVRAFLPLTNLQNRGAGGVVGIPILTLENINNGQMSLQQWGITDVMSFGPPKTFNSPRHPSSPNQPRMIRPPIP